MQRLPVLSLALAALAGLAMLLPAGLRELLYFDRGQLAHGNPLGLVTGHWLHADAGHLAWNAGALLILSAIIESYSRRLLAWSLAAGTLAVDVLLLSPWCGLERYCGLSGVLNSLLAVALYLRWQETRSPLVAAVALGGVMKIALEMNSGQSLFTHISWPPFAAAHLAGLLGGILLLGQLRVAREASARPSQTETRTHGYLGTGK